MLTSHTMACVAWINPPESVVPLPNRYDTNPLSLLNSKTNVPKNAAEAPQKWFQDNKVEALQDEWRSAESRCSSQMEPHPHRQRCDYRRRC